MRLLKALVSLQRHSLHKERGRSFPDSLAHTNTIKDAALVLASARASVLAMLEEREISRQRELNCFARVAPDDDEAAAAPCASRIFSPREFAALWSLVKDYVARCWNVGRGKRSQLSGEDVFFVLFVTMKCGDTWNVLSRILSVKSPIFTKTMNGFIRVVAPKLYEVLGDKAACKEMMKSLVASRRTMHVPSLPMRSLRHGRDLPTHKPAIQNALPSTAPSTRGATRPTLPCNMDFHRRLRAKSESDQSLEGAGPMQSQYPDKRADLADKGYQRLADDIRCIHPEKGTNLLVDVDLTNFHIVHTGKPLRDASGAVYNQSQTGFVAIGNGMVESRRLSQGRFQRHKRLRQQISLDDLQGHDDELELTQRKL